MNLDLPWCRRVEDGLKLRRHLLNALGMCHSKIVRFAQVVREVEQLRLGVVAGFRLGVRIQSLTSGGRNKLPFPVSQSQWTTLLHQIRPTARRFTEQGCELILAVRCGSRVELLSRQRGQTRQ